MTRTVVTYRDYAALPEDGRRCEVHDRELLFAPLDLPPFTDLGLIPSSLWA